LKKAGEHLSLHIFDLSGGDPLSKKYSLFITALFCLFIGGFCAAHFLVPDQAFSETENRYLAQLPDLKLGRPDVAGFLQGGPLFRGGNLFSGEFMSDFETYVNDQFPLRDGWVSLKARAELLTGKHENNGVFFGDRDTLLVKLAPPDMDELAQKMEYVDTLVQQAGVPVYFSLIPSSAAIWADRLPDNAPTADQKAIIDRLSGSTLALYYDTYAALAAHSGEDIYYRTDHHWTTLGAYYGYAALMEAMGLEPTPLSDYTPTVVSDRFYGTSYSTSGVRWLPPDSITAYVPGDGVAVTSWFTGQPQEGRLYAPEYLAQKDKYSYFLGGNQPLCVIQGKDPNGPRLLLVRDSYSDSMAPFLIANCSEIHLFDLRYNRTPLSSYLRDNGIDAAVVLYSLPNFISDANLFLLAQ